MECSPCGHPIAGHLNFPDSGSLHETEFHGSAIKSAEGGASQRDAHIERGARRGQTRKGSNQKTLGFAEFSAFNSATPFAVGAVIVLPLFVERVRIPLGRTEHKQLVLLDRATDRKTISILDANRDGNAVSAALASGKEIFLLSCSQSRVCGQLPGRSMKIVCATLVDHVRDGTSASAELCSVRVC